jgi:hypothetical protein
MDTATRHRGLPGITMSSSLLTLRETNWEVVIQAVKCGTTSRDSDRCFVGLGLHLLH